MAKPVAGGRCKDCEPGVKRPAPHPGPRCVTHHRAVVKARRLAAQEKRVLAVYGLPADQYDEIYAKQGARCFICQRATGARKRLAVDHDHTCCNGPTSCGQCVRGLLCTSCNKNLGYARDNPAVFLRAALYLACWPSGRKENHPWLTPILRRLLEHLASDQAPRRQASPSPSSS